MITEVDALVELAKEAEVADPFDWSDTNINEEDAYRLVALSIAEMENDPLVLKASLTKLVVENMVLNLRLMNNGKT